MSRLKRTLADSLTLFRFVAAAVVWLGLDGKVANGVEIALAAFLAGAASDFLDGRLAREAGGHTAFGRFADPLADKALTLAALAGLALHGIIGWWLVWLIVARDALITWARAQATGKASEARGSGKWKTVFQMLFIISAFSVLVVSGEPAPDSVLDRGFFWASAGIAVLTLWSGVRYLSALSRA